MKLKVPKWNFYTVLEDGKKTRLLGVSIVMLKSVLRFNALKPIEKETT